MAAYLDNEQETLQRRVLSAKQPARPQAAYRPARLVTELADIDHGCRVAGKRGWTKPQVAATLREFGCSWKDGKITACPEQNRGELLTRLTVGKP
jgi:hypothetical protein